MDLHEVRVIIRTALARETVSGAFRARLAQELPQLQRVLLLPAEQSVEALKPFSAKHASPTDYSRRSTTTTSIIYSARCCPWI